MSVDIEPQELSFRRPFTVEVAQTLTIKNATSTPLAFKVKTTAPKQYCVRPNAGRIEPGQDFDVTVLLQAMKADPALDAKCRDKFLVQSAPITSDKEFASIGNVLDSTDKSHIQERKIRVNWLPAGVGHEHDAAAAAAAAAQPAVATPSKQSLVNGRSNDTPATARSFSSPRANNESTPATGAPPSYSQDNVKDEEDSRSERPKSAVSQAATAVSETAQVTYDELKVKLAQAEAQIASLRDSGLRQRNVKAAPGADRKPNGPTTQAVKQADGVPVQIVAILCLLSFLLAYFFF
ncbi:hypothetical protein CDD83_7887 [Cordyceps sp. RAO-2017]|nr:hypothetical protein CDD83_7887 [Cordyceps sp. RAO-2017]